MEFLASSSDKGLHFPKIWPIFSTIRQKFSSLSRHARKSIGLIGCAARRLKNLPYLGAPVKILPYLGAPVTRR